MVYKLIFRVILNLQIYIDKFRIFFFFFYFKRLEKCIALLWQFSHKIMLDFLELLEIQWNLPIADIPNSGQNFQSQI